MSNGNLGFSDVPAYGQIPEKLLCRNFWAPKTFVFERIKATFHLKRVMVTPAVCQLFVPLDRDFKYWYWADITFYTHPYGVAEGCVFVKQSDPPCNCTL